MLAEEIQDDERQQVAHGNAGYGVRRRQRRHDDAGHGGARRLLKRGAEGAFHAVGRQQVLRRQDPRQDRGVRREEERCPDTQDEGASHEVPELKPACHRQPADGCDDGEVGSLDGDDQQPLRDAVRCDAARKNKRHQAHAARRGHEGEFQRPPADVDDLVDHGHGPHA